MKQVERRTSNKTEIGGGVILAGSMGVLTRLHVQDLVLLVFDGPISADRLGYADDVGDGAEVVGKRDLNHTGSQAAAVAQRIGYRLA